MKEGFLLAVVLALPAAAQAQLKPGPYLQLEFPDVRSGTTGVKTLSGASPRDTIAILDKSGAGIVVGWGLQKKGKNTLAVEWGARTWGTTKNSPSHQLFGDGTYLRASSLTGIARQSLTGDSKAFFGYGLGIYDIQTQTDADPSFPNSGRTYPGLAVLLGRELSSRIFGELRTTVLPNFSANQTSTTGETYQWRFPMSHLSFSLGWRW